jgi:uncharacterized membrane protein
MKPAIVLAFLIALLLAILPAGAVESFYEVTGVSAGDVLNIRSRPSASAPKVGAYGPRANGIRIYRRAGSWALVGRIGHRFPDGWVNARFLRRTVTDHRVPLPLQCLGTEPFWSVTIHTPRRATYSDPETAGRVFRVSDFLRIGRDARFRLGVAARSRIEARACSDGMSDTVYPYTARIRLPGGAALEGCCRAR